MSQENVEIVLGLHAGPDLDLAHVFRDDAAWARFVASFGPALSEDFECVTRGFPDNDGTVFPSLDAFRGIFLEWLAPWEHYRTEIENTIDVGDSVVVLVRDFGRRSGATNELPLRSAAVWTLRDGKVRRIEFCADRGTALKAVGLEK